ncbi:MAG: hypothetical protein Kow0019_17600 [Methanobacteriaceae archaeon]
MNWLHGYISGLNNYLILFESFFATFNQCLIDFKVLFQFDVSGYIEHEIIL